MKTAIVTGSGSGIGRAVAMRLASDGYRVTVNDILLDQAESVATDVERIRRHPLVPRSIPIYAYIYQVETGRIIEVPAASALGRGT